MKLNVYHMFFQQWFSVHPDMRPADPIKCAEFSFLKSENILRCIKQIKFMKIFIHVNIFSHTPINISLKIKDN